MRYRRCECKKNPYLPSLGFDAGSVWMHTGRTKVEPVEFLGYTRYGAGASQGDPSQVEVRALDGGRIFQTTVDRLRTPRVGEVTTRENPRRRKNPSAVYGAFRANPDWTEAELFAFLRQHPDGITVKELVYGFGGTSQGHTTRLEKLVERGALKRERWAKGGDHYLLPEKGNPVAKYYKVPLSNFTVKTLPEVGMTFYSDGSIHLAQSALPKWKPGSKRRPPMRAPRSYLPVGWWRVIRGGPSSSPLWVQRAEIPYVHRDSP